MNARKAAFTSLLRCEKAGKYTGLEVDAAIRKYGLDESERSLYTALVYGVTERSITLDHIIGCYCRLPMNKLAPAVRVILRLGLYQILFLSRVPDHAAVNESVELAKCYCRSAASLVNAVLRCAVREGEKIVYPDRATEYGLRADLWQLWCESYGAERTERMARALSEPAYLTLHTNTLRITPAQLQDEIECESTVGALSADCVRLCEAMPVTDFAPLADGLCFVQDESSAYAASLVDARPGMFVIDACACPGGKSFALALQMRNEGTLLSCDLHENKLSLIERGAQTLGIDIITTRARDARTVDPDLIGRADRVLCDVPCSGLGVLRKKPDLRHKAREEYIHLPQVQYDILCSCAQYVRVGGILVYSTCTLNPAENEQVVARFLAEHPEFAPACFDGGHTRTIFPDEYATDGFFVARMVREK